MHTASSSDRTTLSTNVVLQLHREWRRLRHHPQHLLRAAGWQLAAGDLGDLDDVLTLVGYEVRANPAHERALRRLVEIARHDDLAARVIVQRLLPGSLSVVRRQRQFGRDQDAVAEMIGALWIAIRTFNPTRQPSCIAAALIGDAEYLAFKRADRQRSSSETPSEFPADIVQPDQDLHPWEELAQLVLDAAGSGTTRANDLAFLRCLLETPNTADIAGALGVSPRTVRNHRAKATQHLRALAAA